MLMPRKKEMDLFDEMFSDPFFSMKESRLMKTDIKEIDDGYEIEVDLPGYNKEDIQLEIDNGYLTVTAKKDEEDEEKKKKYTGHIPPMTHPWKMASYQAYLLSNKRTEDYAYN